MRNLRTIYLLLRMHLGRVASLMATPRWARVLGV
jgi:hypothetical protein